jgi:hypothetical protein
LMDRCQGFCIGSVGGLALPGDAQLFVSFSLSRSLRIMLFVKAGGLNVLFRLTDTNAACREIIVSRQVSMLVSIGYWEQC